MKGILIITILFFAITASGFLYFTVNKNGTKAQENKITEDQEGDSSLQNLVVAPQTPTDKVIVEKLTLKKDGFLALREMEGDTLSQIVEISTFLKAGTHTDVEIPLNNVDITDKDLIVMVYEDQENDQVFNDLEIPAVNEKGSLIARYVKTGEPLPENLVEGNTSDMPAHSMEGMVTVKYTDNGFTPKRIEINEGDMVEFRNESSRNMWVASANHPAHEVLPTFDQFRAFTKGSVYRYVFKKTGSWEYHDHINPSLGGVVVVN